jgi:hypothetical protein
VQLDEVDRVGLESFQRAVDLAPGGVAVALVGLGREEDARPDPRHPRPESHLGIAVPRGHVEMVDAGVERLLDGAVGRVLVDLGQRRRPIDQYRALVAEPTEPASLHQVLPGQCG